MTSRPTPGAPGGANPGRRWMDLTADGARQAIERDPVLVLPMGAVEQHGPHLPLSTDLDIVRALTARAVSHLPAEDPVWVLPAQAVGASREHDDVPGTLSLEPETVGAVVEAVGDSLGRVGARRLVVVNAHGGNRSVLDGPALRLRRRWGMLVVKAHYFRFERPAEVDLPAGEWRHGLHGGAVETAMMLHLHPERVRRDRIVHHPSLGQELEATLQRLGPEGEAAFAWTARDLSSSGVTGDPRLATEEMGRALVDHYARCLAQVIDDARAFPLDRLAYP